MEFLSAEFFTALFIIILIDLVLAGDNAIVIGMAARNLPKENQKKVILWGTAGAIIIRMIATILVLKVFNSDLPWVHLIGGLLLVWISLKLLIDEKNHVIDAKSGFWSAIGTIIVADAAMGLDNVLAVASAAHGDVTLVILGLIISIPIMVWGSTLLIKWMDRFPAIIYIGSGILAWTAAKMITVEPILLPFLKEYEIVKWIIVAGIILGVLAAGKWITYRRVVRNAMLRKINEDSE